MKMKRKCRKRIEDVDYIVAHDIVLKAILNYQEVI